MADWIVIVEAGASHVWAEDVCSGGSGFALKAFEVEPFPEEPLVVQARHAQPGRTVKLRSSIWCW